MSNYDKEAQDLIEFLIKMGILKPLGYDKSIGDEMYLVSQETQNLMPELAKMQQQELNATVFDLWSIDMIDVTFGEDGEPMIGLNKNSTDINKIEAIEDEKLRNQMYFIVSIFSKYFDENEKQ
jgi:hypothetical protein